MRLFSKLSLNMRFKHNIQMFDTVQQLLRDNCRQLAFFTFENGQRTPNGTRSRKYYAFTFSATYNFHSSQNTYVLNTFTVRIRVYVCETRKSSWSIDLLTHFTVQRENFFITYRMVKCNLLSGRRKLFFFRTNDFDIRSDVESGKIATTF